MDASHSDAGPEEQGMDDTTLKLIKMQQRAGEEAASKT